MSTSKTNLFVVVAVSAVLAIAGAVFFNRDQPAETRETVYEPETSSAVAGTEARSLDSDGVSDFETPAASDDLDEIERLEQERWKISRGFITDETRYLTRLSTAELDMMIAQGSTQAMRTRGGRLLDDPDAMFTLFEDAIVLGDLPALLTAASVWPHQGVKSGRNLLAVSDDAITNMLALMLTAQLRGDNLLTPVWRDRLLEGVEITEVQVTDACVAAHTLLDRLEAERARRGLPPFDNTPSPYGDDWRDSGPIGAICS